MVDVPQTTDILYDKTKMKRISYKYNPKPKCSLENLKKELVYKPHILKFILYLQRCLVRRKKAYLKIKAKYEYTNSSKVDLCDAGVQTEDVIGEAVDNNEELKDSWQSNVGDESEKSLSDQIKEAAESALQQSGMVYEETSGMYYDYSTGYYYNAETGLYYHNSTGCYYYYDKDQNTFVFHSQASVEDFPYRREDIDISQPKISKSKGKHKKIKESKLLVCESKIDDDENKSNKRATSPTDCDTVTKKSKNSNADMLKNKKNSNYVSDCVSKDENHDKTQDKNEKIDMFEDVKEIDKDDTNSNSNDANYNVEEKIKSEGECDSSDEESDSSSSNESITAHHPPCMRIIVTETSLDTIKTGSLFILTKEGGTLGREGEGHAVLIPDENVSRHHLTFTYNEESSIYYVKDVGSRNGTILNSKRMSSSQKESDLFEVVHGSVIHLGSTKLVCHIHKGNDTCGHCEPGLLIKETVSDVKTYRPMDIKNLHRQELNRLKNKYKLNRRSVEAAGEKLLPEGYQDKAKLRRDTVGSLHHGVKTEQADVEKSISSTNKGYKLLQKMGWSAGDGLGKTSQGYTEPVPMVSNMGTSGLGTGNTITSGSLVAAASSSISSSNIRKHGIWLATQRRYDKANTSSFFNRQEDTDDENADVVNE